MASNDLSDVSAQKPPDREQTLESINALYAQGEISAAFERLESLLKADPENTELRLVKAEWSLERQHNASYVGQVAEYYRSQAHTSVREQQVIRGAQNWAEAACASARRELTVERIDEGVRELRTAVELAPWDISMFMARAVILVEAGCRHSADAGDSGQGSLPGLPGSTRREARSVSPVHFYKEIESALVAVRRMTAPGKPLWLEATQLLVEWMGELGEFDAAKHLLEEAAQAGADSSHQLIALEERMSDKAVGDAVDRIRQLMRQGKLSVAGDLLAGVVQAAPHYPRVWLALADWFVLRRDYPAAESIYRWVWAGGSTPGKSHTVDARILAPVTDLMKFVEVECRRCHRSLNAAARSCPACGQSVGDLTLPGDTFPEGAKAPTDAALIGLIEIYIQQKRSAEALEQVQLLIDRLDRKHPALKRLGELMESLEPQAVAASYERALQAAIDRVMQKDVTAAQAQLAALVGHRAADERLQVWQAIAAASGELCPDHLPIIRRATNVNHKTWVAIPIGLRHRVVRMVLAAGWLEEARHLLSAVYNETQRNSKKVRGLAQWCEREIQRRCTKAAADARSALAKGQLQVALTRIDEVLSLEPDHPAALLARGEAQLVAETPYTAAADFRSVLLNRDSDAASRDAATVGLAQAYEQLHDLPGALRALDALPNDLPEARSLRARLERQRQGLPAVRVGEVNYSIHPDTLRRLDEETPRYAAIFGVVVRSAARWRDDGNQLVSRRDIAHIGHEFIATLGGLAGARGNPAFELRLIAEPDADLASRGRLHMAILCRVTHAVPEGAEHIALELWDKMRAHLPMAEQFIYQYEPVFDEEELDMLIEPFEMRDAAEIVRRTATAEGAYAIQLFTSGMTSLENLAWTLLRQSSRAMVSVYLQPTYIQAAEIAAFKTSLDKLRWVRLPKNDEDGDSTDSEMEEVARTVILPDGTRGTLLDMVAHLANALEKQAFLMSVTVASEEPHAELLSHAVAAEIFGPGGRYDVIHAADDAAFEIVRSNRENIELERWIPASVPRRLARLRYLVTEQEAGWTFRLPMPGVEGIPGVPQIGVKAAPPARLPAEGLLIGETAVTIAGTPADIRMLQADRRRHMYVLGKTGVGKSTLLEMMALQDIEAGRGVMFLDPHGDSVEAVLSRVPPERADDVILLDPSDAERPIGVNILQNEDDHQKHRIASEFVEMLIKMYDPHHVGIAGPIWQHTGRMGMLTAMMALPDATLVDVVRILTDEDYGRRLGKQVSDPLVRIYWEEEVPRTSQQRKGEMLTYIVSKFNRFTGDLRLRNIVGQAQSALDFRRIIDERKILLVSLSKGKIGPESAEFLGFIILQSLLIAALSRADQAREARIDFCLYVDEFQTFATQSFAALLSEGRKYGLCMVMANQYLGQLTPSLREAVFGNVGTMAAFQVDANDGHEIAPQFYPVYGPDDLINLPRYTAAVRLMVDGQATRPFAMRTRLSPRLPDARTAQMIRELSRTRYGRDVEEVNREIGARFKL